MRKLFAASVTALLVSVIVATSYVPSSIVAETIPPDPKSIKLSETAPPDLNFVEVASTIPPDPKFVERLS